MNRFRTEIKWAVILSVLNLLWLWLEKLSGLHSTRIALHPLYTNLVILPTIAVYVLAIKEKRDTSFNGKMDLMQGFVSGMTMSIFTALLVPVTQSIGSLLISPEFFPKIIDYVVETGRMSSEAAADFFNLKSYIIQGAIGTPVLGFLISGGAAFFLRTDKK